MDAARQKALSVFISAIIAFPGAAMALDPAECAYYTAKLKRSARNADDAGQTMDADRDEPEERRDAIMQITSELDDVERYLKRARKECLPEPAHAPGVNLAPGGPGKSSPLRGP